MSQTPEEVRARIREAARRHLAALHEEAKAPDFSQRATFSHMVGVYLAVNAIPDVRLLVEGPDCTHLKTQYLEGNHDLEANLTSLAGLHRIANTALLPSSMISSREEAIHDLLVQVGSLDDTRAVLLAAMPMAAVTGADYDRLCVEASEACGRPCLSVKGQSVSGDWLDGYAAVLETLARRLPLPEVPTSDTDPRHVALVGYLWDRNEQDHRANVDHLRALLGALGLEVTSVWLSGEGVDSLEAVARAGTILGLPYGRDAGRILAERLGRPLLELPLPFGFDATERFLEILGDHFDVEAQARREIEAGLARTVPRLEWLVPLVFQGLRAGFVGDPFLAPGLAQMITLLGGELAFVAITNRVADIEAGDLGVPKERFLVHPSMRSLRLLSAEAFDEGRIHLVIGNLLAGSVWNPEPVLLELGFPSLYTHTLTPRPFLGFDGALAFLEQVANRLRMGEVEEARLFAWLREL